MKKELTHFIAKHIDEQVDAQTLPTATCCAFTGEKITQGVPLKKVIKSATANLADTFKVASDFVSIETARCFKAQRTLRGNLFIDEGTIVAPMVSAKSAIKFNRPTWVEMLTDFCENPRDCLILLTEESKRRLWIDAQLNKNNGTGYGTAYLNAYHQAGVLHFHCQLLIEMLDCITTCMQHGFSKDAIRHNLFRQHKIYTELGLMQSRELEQKLKHYREDDPYTFYVAVFIATLPVLADENLQTEMEF